jgi:Uma2 family endonuclease
LEFVGGRLLYMPPCGTEQAAVASDLNFVLVLWGRQHPEFIVGGNAAGLLIDEEARGAEAMVWRRDSMGAHRRGFLRVPPILVAEVAGEDDTERSLLEKARWYLDRSVGVVWLLLPRTREVVVITPRRSLRRRAGQRLPRHRSLPGLEPSVDDLFRQLP